MNKTIKMAIFGITAFVILSTGNTVSAAIPPSNQMERIPFTNLPVTPGDPESYIGTYGQCPFYENSMEKGCFPPSDIKCNADWSYCEYVGTTWQPEKPATTPVTPSKPKNESIPAPAPKTPETAPKTVNNDVSEPSYAPPAANDTTNVNETPETVDVANDDVNKNVELAAAGGSTAVAAQTTMNNRESHDDMDAIANWIAIACIVVAGATIVWVRIKHPQLFRDAIHYPIDKFNEFAERVRKK